MDINDVNFLNMGEAIDYLRANPLPVEHIQKKYSRKQEGVVPVFYDWKYDKNGGKKGRVIYYTTLIRDFEQSRFLKNIKGMGYYVYNGKHYELWNEEESASYLEEKLLENDDRGGLRTGEIQTFKSNLQRVPLHDINDLESGNSWCLPLQNGILDLRTLKLKPFHPRHFFTYSLGWSWDDSCFETPYWDKLLDLVLGDKEKIKRLLEFYIGYTLSGANTKIFQYFLILYGSGNNGKSFLLDVVKKMLGEQNYTTKKLSSVLRDELAALSSLEGKLALFSDDEKEDVFINTSLLKELTGGNETISIRRLYKDPYEKKLVTKLWITTNVIPYTPDTTDGFRRRILLVPFTKKIDKTKAIRDDVGDKAMFVKEFPGIVKRCMRLFLSAMDSRTLELPEEIEQMRDRMCRKSDNVGEWLNDSLVYTGKFEHMLSIGLIFDVYANRFNTGSRRFEKKKSTFTEEVRMFVDKLKEEHENGLGRFKGDTNPFGALIVSDKQSRATCFPDTDNDEVYTKEYFTQYVELYFDYDKVQKIRAGLRDRDRDMLRGFLFRSEYEWTTKDKVEIIPF